MIFTVFKPDKLLCQDERAVVYEKVREFDNEKEAIENALKRLGAFK